MSELAKDICLQGLTESLTNLFEFYTGESVKVEFVSGEDQEVIAEECKFESDIVSSTIELVGQDVRYFVCMVTTMGVAKGLCRGGASDPVDWIGELANQLFGRFKNHLVEYGVDCELGIPIAGEGVQKTCLACGDGASTLVVNTKAGCVEAIFKAEIDPDLRWTRNAVSVASEEGSIELF
ncbi:hypothetical protein [Rhodopirellula sp. MGV]|uniref:hypothetical protein n=1 Tax=Rhodopirellula sp. MGV TaxID=2023130 RepID=UPI000B96122B|nr:hypothetical protein [Rhodopirellula sp. MGV]OYP37520.1 hypothetical protein CGZ80_05190 [Rhodopirellula sp. MGV]PNY37924.1 hypothetical protein C2E31_05330 [Rhodopirellula baltica]